jgi:hypothetical protein
MSRLTNDFVTQSAANMIQPGIYRRAFDWRLSKLDKDSISNTAAAFVTLSSDEYADIFEDYLTITRKRKGNRMAMAKVQLHLVEELLIAQAAAKQYRDKRDELKAGVIKPDADVEPMKRDLAIVERELFLHRANANCIRAIGDGIAWRALGYDRAALRALSGKAVKQQILEQGTINELHQWASAFDTGQGLAIFNSLTNWLAIGDITIVKDDGSVEVVEVKSGVSDSGRITRQKQTMQEVTNLLKNGKGKLEGQDVTIIRLDISPENDLAALFGLLEEAGRSGFAGRRISDCCYIEAFDFRVMGSADKVWKQGVEQTKKEIAAWSQSNDLVIRIDSLDILSFTPNCAPFSVFPFPERMCVDLLTGAKNYSCFLNLTELGKEFERHGWRIEKAPQELMKEGGGADSSVFRLQKDKMHPEVPPADLMRLSMETVRPSAIIQTLEAVLKLGPEGISSASYVVYKGEKDTWL